MSAPAAGRIGHAVLRVVRPVDGRNPSRYHDGVVGVGRYLRAVFGCPALSGLEGLYPQHLAPLRAGDGTAGYAPLPRPRIRRVAGALRHREEVGRGIADGPGEA